ncbi:MAG: hypothetical protein IJG49_06500 [Erysipelotrichaceae bacterium]|nr:hypothetical protein [Erysipelotrichaceae bacterium]
MIEGLENGIQMILAGICAGIAIVKAVTTRNRTWAFLSMFYFTFFLGDLYWALHIIFYHKTPEFSFIPYLNWISSYLFLWLIMYYVQDGKKIAQPLKRMWSIPVFTFAMAIFYMQYGAYLNNTITAVMMCTLMVRAINGLIIEKEEQGSVRKSYLLNILVLMFCMMEYAMWTVSCFFSGDTLANPYYWFDFGLTVIIGLILRAVRKVVEQ